MNLFRNYLINQKFNNYFILIFSEVLTVVKTDPNNKSKYKRRRSQEFQYFDIWVGFCFITNTYVKKLTIPNYNN